MRPRTLLVPALALVAGAAPVRLALAADANPSTGRVSPGLVVPFAGVSTVDAAMRARSLSDAHTDRARLRRHAAKLGAEVPALPATASPAMARTANRALRRSLKALDVPTPPILHKIAQCESGGDPHAIGGGGSFRGKYQFMVSTWEAVGGTGDPAAAPEAEQDRRAAILLERSGPGQWPVCSR